MLNQDPSETAATEASQQTNPGFRLDRRIWVLIVIALMAVALFAIEYRDAFPEASIDLKLSKEQVTKIGLDCARKYGYHKDHLITSTTFSWDDSAKNYLEMELGSARANELMKDQVPIWYWRTRLCKEFDPESFVVLTSPVGKVIYFKLALENDKAIPSIAPEEARKMAENFLQKEFAVPVSEFTLIESSNEKQTHRTDHYFTWEDRKHPVKDAFVRTEVTVSGNSVSRFYQYLYVPDEWQRKYETMRSYNNTLGRIAGMGYAFLFLAASVLVIWAVAHRNARWHFTLISGAIAGIGFALWSLNNLPDYIDGYRPQTSFRAFLVSYAISTAGQAFSAGIAAAVLIMAGEFMYRRSYPKRIAFENYLKLKAYRTPEVQRGLIVAMCLCCCSLGWVTAYYLIGSHFGYWCPLDVSHHELLGTLVPAYSSVCIGVMAGFSEEILYRVIGLSLAKKLVKNFWLANLIQAAAWGFAHSTYPQQPAYARGLELTLSGLVFGWIMNTFGLLPCIVAHYLLDAFLTAQPLLSSMQPGLVVSALVPLIPIPILAAYAIARAKKSPVDPQQYQNDQIKPSENRIIDIEPARKFDYQPLTAKVRYGLLAALVVSLLAGIALGPAHWIGVDWKVNITRDQAVHRAWEVLAKHNVPTVTPGTKTPAWHVVAWLTDSVASDQLQYVYEKSNWTKTVALADETQPGYYWAVRFFKPSQSEEYEVDLDGQGNEVDFDTKVLDDQPGANLSEDQARAIAEAYVRQTHSQFFPFTLEGTPGKKDKKHRTDFEFTWTVPKEKVAEAESKVTLSVIGDKVSWFGQSWSVPDKWRWEQQKRTWKDELFSNIRMLFGVVVAILMLRWVIGLLRVGYFPFRPAIMFGVAMAVAIVPSAVNDLADAYRSYKTSAPIGTFFINQGVGIFEMIIAAFAQYGLTMLIALPCARLIAPALSPLSLLTATFAPKDATDRTTHKYLWLDATLVSYCALGLWFFTERGLSHLRSVVSPSVHEAPLDAVSNLLNTFFPSMSIVGQAIHSGFGLLVFVPIIVGVYARYFKGFWRYMAFVVVYALISSSGEKYWQEFALDVLRVIGLGAALWVFVARLARFNVLSYILFGICTSLVSVLTPIYLHAPRLLGIEANGTLLLLVLPALYVLYLFLFGKNKGGSAGTETGSADVAAGQA